MTKILVVNVGSTSLKFHLYEMQSETLLAQGKVERIAAERSPFSFRFKDRPSKTGELSLADTGGAIRHVLAQLADPQNGCLESLDELDAVGFKPVHARNIGGAVFITDQVIQAMEDYIPLAPAHNPPYIAAFRIFMELVPGRPLVGVFEPAFHTTIPDYARTYGIPRRWAEKHAIRRYGFHGASHRYVSLRVPELLGREPTGLRLISCHLGGSSSICAVRDGRSVDISMGFSPQSGLPNATRNGDLDPFILLYLMEKEGLSVDELRDALSTEGGLKGISGLSGDVRDLEEAAAAGNNRAALALDVLVHETRKYIGAYAAVLGGLDALAFTGGIGENAARLRQRICSGLEFLGIRLDEQKNQQARCDTLISADGATVAVAVVAAREEWIIALETFRLLQPG